MFIPAPFTAAKKKVKTIQIFLAEEWINKLGYIQTMEDSSALKGVNSLFTQRPEKF